MNNRNLFEMEEPKQQTHYQSKNTQVAIKPENEIQDNSVVENLLTQVIDYAKSSGELFDEKSKSLALEIITLTNNKILADKEGITWNNIDIAGCNLIGQIKRWAFLGLRPEDGLWVDIRKNKYKENMRDINIKCQYQCLEKLIIDYFPYKVLRFRENVICIGDELEIEENFATGLDEIKKHKKNTKINRNDLENIIGAYKILYYLDNSNNIIPILVQIDKNRINRAKDASKDAVNAWKNDAYKMVIKTVTWELWKSANIRPFMQFSENVAKSIEIIEESENMNWNNKEREFNDVNEAQNNVKNNVSSNKYINVKYEDED